eukprot:Lankesteria_metandrocarpae@DN4280_c0_g1_i1.p2
MRISLVTTFMSVLLAHQANSIPMLQEADTPVNIMAGLTMLRNLSGMRTRIVRLQSTMRTNAFSAEIMEELSTILTQFQEIKDMLSKGKDNKPKRHKEIDEMSDLIGNLKTDYIKLLNTEIKNLNRSVNDFHNPKTKVKKTKLPGVVHKMVTHMSRMEDALKMASGWQSESVDKEYKVFPNIEEFNSVKIRLLDETNKALEQRRSSWPRLRGCSFSATDAAARRWSN